MNDRLPVEFLERLVKLGKSLPKGPWTTPKDAGNFSEDGILRGWE